MPPSRHTSLPLGPAAIRAHIRRAIRTPGRLLGHPPRFCRRIASYSTKTDRSGNPAWAAGPEERHRALLGYESARSRVHLSVIICLE